MKADLRALLPSLATLDAVDDDARSGRRPCPISNLTIADVRELHELLAIAEAVERAPVAVLQSIEHSMKAGGQTLVTYRVLEQSYHAPWHARLLAIGEDGNG